MDPLNETEGISCFSRERVWALVSAFAEMIKKPYAESANLLLDLLKSGPDEREVEGDSKSMYEALRAFEQRERGAGWPPLFSEPKGTENPDQEGPALSFFGQYVYRVLREWAKAGDLRLLAEMTRNAWYSQNEAAMAEAVAAFSTALQVQERAFSRRVAEIEKGRRPAPFRKLVEVADRLSKELLESLRILKTSIEEGAPGEEVSTHTDQRPGAPHRGKIADLIDAAERFLRKTLSIVDVYETLWEEECDRLFSSKPRVIESQLLPALLAPYPSSSSQEAYHSFFRLLIPPAIPQRVCLATRLTHRGDTSIKKETALRKKREKTPFDSAVLLFFLTLLKQVRIGKTTLSDIMQKIPITEELPVLFMRLHLSHDIWFHRCGFRELEEALRRKRMKNDYLGIRIETTDSLVTIGQFRMNDLSFRLMGRRG